MQLRQLLQPVYTRVHHANQTVATASLYTGAQCKPNSCYSQSIHGFTTQLRQLLQPVYTRVHHATRTVATASLCTGALLNLIATASLYMGVLRNVVATASLYMGEPQLRQLLQPVYTRVNSNLDSCYSQSKYG